MQRLFQNEWKQGSESSESVILDVRTPEEWEDGIIPGAVTLNIFDAHGFMDAISKMDTSKDYYLYCRSGARSGQACQIMASKGFQNVNNLEGGIMDWTGDVVEYKAN
jgi:rhodanese-related sulfurtransferase